MTSGDASDRAGEAAMLKGWKEIARFFGKDERTVKRWAATRSLPVHRPAGRSSTVFADPGQLRIWIREQEAARRHPAPREPRQDPPHRQRQRIGRVAALAGLTLCIAVAVPAVTLWLPGPARAPDLASPAGQLHAEASYLWRKRTPEALRESARLLDAAIARDPSFARARADLATVHNLMVELRMVEPAVGYGRSRAEALEAAALDPRLASPHAVLADIEFFQDLGFEAALDRFRHAVGLDPNDAQTRQWYAAALSIVGNDALAIEEISRAQALDPQSRSILNTKGIILLAAGRPGEAARLFQRLVANEPDYRAPWRFIAFLRFAAGDFGGYLDALERRARLSGDEAGEAVVAAGRAGLRSGGRAAMVDKMSRAAELRDAEPYLAAHVLAQTGNAERAFAALAAVATRQAFYYTFDPAFAHLRGDPAFVAAAAKSGFPVHGHRKAAAADHARADPGQRALSLLEAE